MNRVRDHGLRLGLQIRVYELGLLLGFRLHNLGL
jgi:hypothetical protein